MSHLHTTVTLERLVAVAADLASEEGENYEYDRALQELIADTGLLPDEAYDDGMDTARPYVANLINQKRKV